MINLKDYKHVFMPFADIYALGGPPVLEVLSRKQEGEKNLITLPIEMSFQLKNPTKSGGLLGIGGQETLYKILELKDMMVSIPDEGIVIYPYDEGLDIAVYMNEEKGTSSAPLTTALTEKIKSQTGKIPEIFTRDSELDFNYTSQGFKVDSGSRFLLTDSKIVERGILTGNSILHARLHQSPKKELSLEQAVELLNSGENPTIEELYLNQFVIFSSPTGSEYAKVIGEIERTKDNSRIINVKNKRLKLLGHNAQSKKLYLGDYEFKNGILGIIPWDMEQYLVMQAVLDPNIEVAIIAGGSGSGKTVTTYIPSLFQILKHPEKSERIKMRLPENRDRVYEQMILLKSNDLIGGDSRDIGWLPGSMWKKIKDTLAPYKDAHELSDICDEVSFQELFMHTKRENEVGGIRDHSKKIGGFYLPTKEAVELTTTAYLRGRSFEKIIIIVDETQNLTPYEAKTILERAGIGTKVIYLGDPEQFDNSRCSPDVNGLTAISSMLLKHDISCLIKLPKCYRSQGAEIARQTKIYSK